MYKIFKNYEIYKKFTKFPGGNSSGVTPVPIPNTEVKTITPKILVWRRTGKIGTARFNSRPLTEKLAVFFF